MTEPVLPLITLADAPGDACDADTCGPAAPPPPVDDES